MAIKVIAHIKQGNVTRKVEVTILNTEEVAEMLGITTPATLQRALKAGVGQKDAGSVFFTPEEVEVLRAWGDAHKRGRPVGSVKVQGPTAPAINLANDNDRHDVIGEQGEDNDPAYFGHDNMVDFGAPEEVEATVAA